MDRERRTIRNCSEKRSFEKLYFISVIGMMNAITAACTPQLSIVSLLLKVLLNSSCHLSRNQLKAFNYFSHARRSTVNYNLSPVTFNQLFCEL